MDARQRVGAVLAVAGAALVVVGIAGALMTPGQPVTAVGSPTPAAATPMPTTAAQPTVTPAPAAATVGPSVEPSAVPAHDTPRLVRSFFAELQEAIRIGAHEEMLDRLAEAVLDRYGRTECATNLSTRVAVPEQAFEILDISASAPWDYVTDELTTTVPDAITVAARVTGPDASGLVTTEERELHVQVIDNVVYWFTDCGEPLP